MRLFTVRIRKSLVVSKYVARPSGDSENFFIGGIEVDYEVIRLVTRGEFVTVDSGSGYSEGSAFADVVDVRAHSQGGLVPIRNLYSCFHF